MSRKTLRSLYKGLTIVLAVLALAFMEAAAAGTLAPIMAIGLIPATLYACYRAYALSKRRPNRATVPVYAKRPAKMGKAPVRSSSFPGGGQAA